MRLSRPTPSFAVATLALVAASGGAGYAASQIQTKNIANNAVTSAKVKNGTLTGKDLSAGAALDLHGTWALVNPTTPSLDADHTRGFSSVSHPATGTYCLKPSKASAVLGKAVAVTVDWGSSSGSNLLAQWRMSAGDCPDGQVEVLTFQIDSTGDVDPYDGVGFSVVVP